MVEGLCPSSLLRERLSCLRALLAQDRSEITITMLLFGEGQSDTIPSCWQSCLWKMRRECCSSGSCQSVGCACFADRAVPPPRTLLGQGRSPGEAGVFGHADPLMPGSPCPVDDKDAGFAGGFPGVRRLQV